jgi:D-beta-D-heptose 7-phosphate kinase/D-beta-D-heptose 1-phosphate adenosyltransferase
MTQGLLVIGDSLLDREVSGRSERLSPDAPVPVVDQTESRARGGGAALAATLAAQTGEVPVTLLTALAADPAGEELRRTILAAGVDLIDLGLDGATAEKIRILDHGRPLLRLDRGGGGRVARRLAPARIRAVVAEAGAVLVSDYGNGGAASPSVRAALESRPAAVPLVWDPHPRGPDPVGGTTLATPNRDEAIRVLGAGTPGDLADAIDLATALLGRWSADAIAVTCGGEGAVLARREGEAWCFGCDVVDGDPCGAGDRFAAEAARVLAAGEGPDVAVAAAVSAAAEFVAAGGAAATWRPAELAGIAAGAGGAGPPSYRLDDAALGSAPVSIEPALRLAARTRERGGTVVATGGCFDLLHVGHLRTLERARALGECLIVLLNGDRSVRALKGAARPVVGELERAAMLKALACVDEVAIFDEHAPVDALRLLRPDVWAKGGDYAIDQLPERDAIAEWGGNTAILPELEGRSTTKLIERVEEHG